MLSPPFQYLERLFSRNSSFSKGAKAYFAFLEREKKKGANLQMNDHEKDNEYEEFLKIFEKSHSSGSDDTQEDTPAIHRKQPLQEPKRSTRQMPPRPGSTSRQNSAPLSEYPVRRTQPTRKPGMYLSPKRKAAKKTQTAPFDHYNRYTGRCVDPLSYFDCQILQRQRCTEGHMES